MATRGIQRLRARGIEHEVLTYRYVKKGARIAADAVGLPEEVVLKSLVFRADDGSFLFVLLSGNANVSTRKVGRATGHKHVEAASPRDAERMTGYRPRRRDQPARFSATTPGRSRRSDRNPRPPGHQRRSPRDARPPRDGGLDRADRRHPRRHPNQLNRCQRYASIASLGATEPVGEAVADVRAAHSLGRRGRSDRLTTLARFGAP